MQAVPATAGERIDQRYREIIATEEPAEGARCPGFPFSIAVGTPRREAGSDRCRCFHGLLIKRAGMLPPLAEAGGADRPEMTCRGCLLRHEPAKSLQSGIDIL